MIHKMEADSIQLEFGTRKILSDIYIQCETGKITGLLGRNGNGKTSLMNIIYGNLNASHKSVRFDGKMINTPYLRPELLRYLPQFHFIPKNISLKRAFSDFNVDYAPFEVLFPEFNNKYLSPLSSLSGGQRRLIEIYTILKSDTQFVLLDEPFSNLSPVWIESIQELLTTEKQHKGILVTDHLYREIIAVQDNLYLLVDGRIQLIKDLAELEYLEYVRF